jgi:hypothetical protein
MAKFSLSAAREGLPRVRADRVKLVRMQRPPRVTVRHGRSYVTRHHVDRAGVSAYAPAFTELAHVRRGYIRGRRRQ